ncbi:MAG TPA: YciI family protein [Devosiaceae bacterium]|jgi:hypothetical protein|nr:YciI family protein [Devosiaceae bacterium]
MRYFMTVNPPREYIDGTAQPPQALMDAMGPFMQKSIEAGALISTAGLKPPAEGAVVRAEKGRITDGPFSESKEVIGGYAVMEAPSLEAAKQLARDFIALHIEHGFPDIEVTVRPVEGGYNY